MSKHSHAAFPRLGRWLARLELQAAAMCSVYISPLAQRNRRSRGWSCESLPTIRPVIRSWPGTRRIKKSPRCQFIIQAAPIEKGDMFQTLDQAPTNNNKTTPFFSLQSPSAWPVAKRTPCRTICSCYADRLLSATLARQSPKGWTRDPIIDSLQRASKLPAKCPDLLLLPGPAVKTTRISTLSTVLEASGDRQLNFFLSFCRGYLYFALLRLRTATELLRE